MCKGLGKIQEGILEFLADGKWVSTKDVQDVCKCAYEYQERQILRSLTRLVAAGKVEKRWGSYDCEAGYCRMDNCDKSSYWYDHGLSAGFCLEHWSARRQWVGPVLDPNEPPISRNGSRYWRKVS
jgi:hypothetical protein